MAAHYVPPEDEDKYKSYFSDVMYRLCGFSGTYRSTPDTYEAFIDRRYTNFALADLQKEVLQGVIEYLINMKNTSEWGMQEETQGGFMYDGSDDWNYNDELDCFDYHYGPVYDIYADESWKEHRDAKEPGYGIYVAHIRPYSNNSLGFKILGIERVE